MPFDLTQLNNDALHAGHPTLDPAYVAQQVATASTDAAVRFERLMAYYRNDQRDAGGLSARVDATESSRPYVQAQEFGLPPRITGFRHDGYGAVFGGRRLENVRRKEVVIENDIAWRIDTMVHFLFGQPLHLESQAADPALRQKIELALNAALEANGGLLFLQEMALLGHIYGFVDILLRTPTALDPVNALRDSAMLSPASSIVLELIEADRAVPVLNDADYRRLDYYVQHFRQRVNRVDANGGESSVAVTEILAPFAWQRYIDGERVAEGPNPLGRLPVVHVQNLPRPFCYEGYSDVERLIPLQDELNTRLSDRASRITFQSFKMYLGRGIDNFEDRPIAPGRMWSTDNPEASIQEFGGDQATPSEDAHIDQVRDALDKVSGVPPVAAGLVRDRLGSLTSGNALKITLSALLGKTAKKRVAYGRALEQTFELILAWLDTAGALHTDPEDRRVRIHWPSMLPENETDRLQQALLKRQLGLPADRVLRELGYADEPDEISG